MLETNHCSSIFIIHAIRMVFKISPTPAVNRRGSQTFPLVLNLKLHPWCPSKDNTIRNAIPSARGNPLGGRIVRTTGWIVWTVVVQARTAEDQRSGLWVSKRVQNGFTGEPSSSVRPWGSGQALWLVLQRKKARHRGMVWSSPFPISETNN